MWTGCTPSIARTACWTFLLKSSWGRSWSRIGFSRPARTGSWGPSRSRTITSLRPALSHGPGTYMVCVGPMFQNRPMHRPLTHSTPLPQVLTSRKVSAGLATSNPPRQNAGPLALPVLPLQGCEHGLIQGQAIDLPGAGLYDCARRCLEGHRSIEALAVVDLGAEVDVAHGLDQDVQAGSGLTLRDLDAVLLGPPVHDADGLAVQEDPGKVTGLLCTRARRRPGGQGRAIQDAAAALVIGLHVARGLVLNGRGQVVEDRGGLAELEPGDRDHRIGGRRLGDGLAGQQVLGHQVAREP